MNKNAYESIVITEFGISTLSMDIILPKPKYPMVVRLEGFSNVSVADVLIPAYS